MEHQKYFFLEKKLMVGLLEKIKLKLILNSDRSDNLFSEIFMYNMFYFIKGI